MLWFGRMTRQGPPYFHKFLFDYAFPSAPMKLTTVNIDLLSVIMFHLLSSIYSAPTTIHHHLPCPPALPHAKRIWIWKYIKWNYGYTRVIQYFFICQHYLGLMKCSSVWMGNQNQSITRLIVSWDEMSWSSVQLCLILKWSQKKSMFL